MENHDPRKAAFLARIIQAEGQNGCSRLFTLLVSIEDDRRRAWVLDKLISEVAGVLARGWPPIKSLRDRYVREAARNCVRVLVQVRATTRTSDELAIAGWMSAYVEEIDQVSRRSGRELPADVQLVLRRAETARQLLSRGSRRATFKVVSFRRVEFIERGIRGAKSLDPDDLRAVERVSAALGIGRRQARQRILEARRGRKFTYEETAKIAGVTQESLESLLGSDPLPVELSIFYRSTGFLDPVFREEQRRRDSDEAGVIAADTGEAREASPRTERTLERLFKNLIDGLRRGDKS